MVINKWNEIWNNKKSFKSRKNLSILQNLIFTDGFDGKTGSVNEKDWIIYTDLLKNKFLSNGNSIYEVGCGSGAFLYPFYLEYYKVGGIDYSKNLIEIARKYMPLGSFVHSEAINIDITNKFDFLISHSVFFYFENYEYAENVLAKMLMKARLSVLILDVPDKDKESLCEESRRKCYPDGEYEKLYKNLGHLYYSKDWFREFGEKNRVSVSFYEQKDFFENYGNSEFRYNVFIDK